MIYASISVVISFSWIISSLREFSVSIAISRALESVESVRIIIVLVYLADAIFREMSTYIMQMSYELTVTRISFSKNIQIHLRLLAHKKCNETFLII